MIEPAAHNSDKGASVPGSADAGAAHGGGISEFLTAPLRERFSQLTIVAGFSLTKDGRRDLDSVARKYRLGTEGIAVTPMGDEEVALLIFAPSPESYRLVLEFRKGQRSPYKRVRPGAVQAALRVVQQHGSDLRLVRWISTVSREDRPPAGAFSLGGMQLTIEGFKVAIQPDAATGRPGASISLDWSGPATLQVDTTTDVPVASLSEAIEVGTRFFADILESLGGDKTGGGTMS